MATVKSSLAFDDRLRQLQCQTKLAMPHYYLGPSFTATRPAANQARDGMTLCGSCQTKHQLFRLHHCSCLLSAVWRHHLNATHFIIHGRCLTRRSQGAVPFSLSMLTLCKYMKRMNVNLLLLFVSSVEFITCATHI